MGFYFFSILTLVSRFILYSIVMSQTLQNSPNKLRIGVWALISDLPHYTYLMTGVSFLLIIGELIISYSLKPDY